MDLSLSSALITFVCWQLLSEHWYCDVEWLCHHFCRMSQIFLSIYNRYAVRVIPGFQTVWCICRSLPPVSDVPLVRSITLIVELRYSIALTLCWSYYYDPRCLRGSSSNLAMICVPSVMIPAIILESIPWCYLVVGILFLGSWTRDSLYLLHVDSNC